MKARVLAGIPAENHALYHRVRFGVGDPAAWLEIEDGSNRRTVFIVRDIEVERAKAAVKADLIIPPAASAPAGGLSGDRATATAQSVAEYLKRAGVTYVVTDRTLPYIYAWHIAQAGLTLDYSAEFGVLERRVKDEQEIQWLSAAQSVTEDAIAMACGTIARAKADAEGNLHHAGAVLTSERMRKMISVYLLERGFSNHHDSIVASLPHSADCHDRGAGPLKTGEAVIVDIFPQDIATHYWGDCTRTVVHGEVRDELNRMHAAVMAAKAAATAALVPGASADAVHAATTSTLATYGYRFARGEISDDPVMPHGTGHGVGLEVHEPILLDINGGTLMEGEVFTVEPGLYGRRTGGVRVEDMLVVRAGKPQNLNRLPEGLDWK
ncbi:MAG: M24 family metallopeptidase [Pirellulales bacterium]